MARRNPNDTPTFFRLVLAWAVAGAFAGILGGCIEWSFEPETVARVGVGGGLLGYASWRAVAAMACVVVGGAALYSTIRPVAPSEAGILMAHPFVTACRSAASPSRFLSHLLFSVVLFGLLSGVIIRFSRKHGQIGTAAGRAGSGG